MKSLCHMVMLVGLAPVILACQITTKNTKVSYPPPVEYYRTVSQIGLVYGAEVLKNANIPYLQLARHFIRDAGIDPVYKDSFPEDARLLTPREIWNFVSSPQVMLITEKSTFAKKIPAEGLEEQWLFPDGRFISFYKGKMNLGRFYQRGEKVCFQHSKETGAWCPYIFSADAGFFLSETKTRHKGVWKFATYAPFKTSLKGEAAFYALLEKRGSFIARNLTATTAALPGKIKPGKDKSDKTIPVKNNDIAIIIGNGKYNSKTSRIPDVSPARTDVSGIYTYLRNVKNISAENILRIDNATQSDLIAVFGSHRNHKGTAYNWVKPGKANLYVYYVGHGAPSKDGGMLVPTDARFDTIELNGYPVQQLLSNLSKIPSKSTTVILESCFSGLSQAGGLISNASPVYRKNGITNLPANINLITAAGPDQIASWQKDRRQSLFTKYLLQGLYGPADAEGYGNGDGKISQFELQTYLDDIMTYQVRRTYGREQTSQVLFAEDFTL